GRRLAALLGLVLREGRGAAVARLAPPLLVELPRLGLVAALVGVEVGVDRRDERVEGRVALQAAARGHLDAAARALVLGDAQALLDALAAEAVEALHHDLRLPQNPQAHGAREVRRERLAAPHDRGGGVGAGAPHGPRVALLADALGERAGHAVSGSGLGSRSVRG
ncbi:unnamed protein product, partial [Pelagomonas calceolata]